MQMNFIIYEVNYKARIKIDIYKTLIYIIIINEFKSNKDRKS